MRFILSSIPALLLSTSLPGQLQFRTSLDTNAILIGEQINLTLEAQLAADSRFSWPAFPDTISGLEVVDISAIDTVREQGAWKLSQNIRLTSFDSGYVAIPPLWFVAGQDSVSSEAIGVAVRVPEIDNTTEYYDIKAPMEAPFSWWLLAAGILALLIVVAVIAAILYFLRKRKRPEIEKAAELSAYDRAIRELERLKEEKLWQQGNVKEYYSRLTDILRGYMHERLHIDAMESTADELIEEIHALSVSQNLKSRSSEFLELSVLVKYAKSQPGNQQHHESFNSVEDFIRESDSVFSKREASLTADASVESEKKDIRV